MRSPSVTIASAVAFFPSKIKEQEYRHHYHNITSSQMPQLHFFIIIFLFIAQ